MWKGASEGLSTFLQADPFDDVPCAFFIFFETRRSLPELEVVASKCLRGEAYIFKDCEIGEDVRDLEGAPDAEMDRAVDGLVRDVLSFVDDFSAGGFEVTAE